MNDDGWCTPGNYDASCYARRRLMRTALQRRAVYPVAFNHRGGRSLSCCVSKGCCSRTFSGELGGADARVPSLFCMGVC